VIHDGNEVPLQHIAEHVALHSPDFEGIREAALARGLLVFLATLLGVTPSEEDTAEESRRHRQRRHLNSAADLVSWRRSNDLNEEEFDQLIRNRACIRRLERWLLGNRGLDRGVRYILDELRLRGVYETWAAAAAQESTIAESYADVDYLDALKDPSLLSDQHLEETGCDIRCTPEWAFDAGFEDVEAVVEALRRAAIARDVRARIEDALSYLSEHGQSDLDDAT